MTASNPPEFKFINLTGILLVILGGLAIFSPAVAGSTLVIVIGCILLLAGIPQILQGVREEKDQGRWASIILGTIETLCGVLVIGHPLLGLSFLTMLLVGYFVIEGLWKIFVSFKLRYLTNWFWLLLSGLVSLLLGVLIWSQWPVSGLWAVGILVGVNLLFTGISLMLVAFSLRHYTAQQ